MLLGEKLVAFRDSAGRVGVLDQRCPHRCASLFLGRNEQGGLRKNAVVTTEVIEVNDGGIEVRIADSEVTAFIRRADLSRDRNDQRPERFSKGEKVDARVTQYDRKTGRIQLSIKALEIAEEKEAVAAYGSSDSGASLGDILGAALKGRDDK